MTVAIVNKAEVYRCDICGRLLDHVEHTCVTKRGVGTELKKVLSKCGIKQTPGCGCTRIENYLNRKGPTWCRENIFQVIRRLERQADKMDVTFNRLAALAIVRFAIALAERQNRKGG